MKVNKFAFIFVAALSTISCTRAVDDSIKLSLDLGNAFPNQKVGSLSGTMEIRRIVVNVTAPDMAPVVYFWSSPCDDGPCGVSAPEFIVIGKTEKDKLKAGAGRLVQVLVVGKDTSANVMAFSYGDKTTSLNAGENSVEVVVNPSGLGSDQEGVVSGQYVEMTTGGGAQGFGPSGALDVVFSPPNGSPKIVVDESEIFNGWFSAIGLKGVPLEYRVRGQALPLQHNGQALGFDQISIISAGSGAASIPSMWTSPNEFWVEDSGMGGRRNSGGGINVLGFYGPASASLLSPKICYSPSLAASTFYEDDASAVELGFSTVIGGSGDDDVYRLGGGVAWSNPSYVTACSDSTARNKTMLRMDMNNLRNGKHAVSGFFGPFASKDFAGVCGMAGDHMAVGCYSDMSGIQQFYWNYLPDIINSGAITGATLFTKVYPSYCDHACEEQFRIQGSDGYQCDQLLNKGFTATYESLSEGSASYSTSSGNYIAPSAHIVAIVCPFKGTGSDKNYFKSGIRIHGNFQAPPPPLTGVNLTTVNDVLNDGWLTDPDTSINPVSATWNAFPGAYLYEVKVRHSGTSIVACEVNTTGTSYLYAAGVGSCGEWIQTSLTDNNPLQIEVVAKNASNQTIAMGYGNVTIMRIPPATFTSLNSLTCSESGGNIVFAINATASSNTDNARVRIKYGPGFTNEVGADLGVSLGAINHPALVGAIPASTTSQSLRLEIKLGLPNGWLSAPFVQMINYTYSAGSGSCALAP